MEMCDLGENSPPFVSMPLAAMRKVVDYLSGEHEERQAIGVLGLDVTGRRVAVMGCLSATARADEQ